MLVEQSLRGSVEKQDIVDDAMIDRYWELLLFPGNREATVLRARMDREPEMAARVGEIAAPTLILFGDEDRVINPRSEEHTSELQSLMRISSAVFCLKKKKTKTE